MPTSILKEMAAFHDFSLSLKDEAGKEFLSNRWNGHFAVKWDPRDEFTECTLFLEAVSTGILHPQNSTLSLVNSLMRNFFLDTDQSLGNWIVDGLTHEVLLMDCKKERVKGYNSLIIPSKVFMARMFQTVGTGTGIRH